MDETLKLFDVKAQPARRAPDGIAYVCPRCWQRVILLLAPEEPPLCDPCSERMIAIPRGEEHTADTTSSPEGPAGRQETGVMVG